MSMAVAQCGFPVNITGTGNISASSCQLQGFYVNSTTGGTLVLRKGGSGGTAISGTITPAIGFHRFPADVKGVLHATVANTINVTFFIASAN